MSGKRWTISSLNQLDQAAFVSSIGAVFEQSPWIAGNAWCKRPFSSTEELHQVMCSVIAGAGADAQLGLLLAHPDLGARIAMTQESVQEQRGAGLTALTSREYRYMKAVNRLYREKFQFPFIIAVKGMTKGEIIAAMGRRYRNTLAGERAEALQQVEKISRFRLDDLVQDEENL